MLPPATSNRAQPPPYFYKDAGGPARRVRGPVAVRSIGTHHSIMIAPTAPPMAQARLSGLAPCSVNARPESGATAVERRGLLSGERARGEADGCTGLSTGGAISRLGLRLAPELRLRRRPNAAARRIAQKAGVSATGDSADAIAGSMTIARLGEPSEAS